jgi:hypothetical protein
VSRWACAAVRPRNPAGAGLQQSAKGVPRYQRNQLIWHGGRAHLRHRASGDLTFGLQLAEDYR